MKTIEISPVTEKKGKGRPVVIARAGIVAINPTFKDMLDCDIAPLQGQEGSQVLRGDASAETAEHVINAHGEFERKRTAEEIE